MSNLMTGEENFAEYCEKAIAGLELVEGVDGVSIAAADWARKVVAMLGVDGSSVLPSVSSDNGDGVVFYWVGLKSRILILLGDDEEFFVRVHNEDGFVTLNADNENGDSLPVGELREAIMGFTEMVNSRNPAWREQRFADHGRV